MMIAYQNNGMESYVKNKFLDAYQHISIEDIQITPVGKLPKDFNNFKLKKYYLSNSALKRSTGTLSALYTNGKREKKLYYKYRITATIGLYKSNYELKRDTIIRADNVTFEHTNFKFLLKKPMNDRQFNRYKTIRNIRAGKIISANDLRRMLDIGRNESVTAIIKDGPVSITFKAKALKGGNIGDIIKIKRDYNKFFKAQIITKHTVEVID
jgi:flagella basal body P-ring formation protein FlgA